MRKSAAWAAFVVASVVVPAQAADFPDVDKLPSQPNMPDPLVMFDGTAVTSKADWFGKRRPELKALFEHYMYGKAPAAPTKVTATVDREDKKALGGKATLKEITPRVRAARDAEDPPAR